MASVYDPTGNGSGIVDSAALPKPEPTTPVVESAAPPPPQGTFASGGAANNNLANPAIGQPAGFGPLMPNDNSHNGSPMPQPASGVVNSAAPAPVMPAPTYKDSAGITPVLGQVSKMDTVQGQLQDILKNGSPLVESAKARAAQAANARGLQNSSMSVQAGEEAMVNQALPIATSDAAAYQKQALVNQEISNSFLSQEKGKAIDLEKAYEAFKQANYTWDKDSSLKQLLQRNDIDSAQKIAAMQAEASKATAGISAAASMSNADKQLEDTRLRLTSAEGMQAAGFKEADLQKTKDFKQRNFETYINGITQINASDQPQEGKTAGVATLNAAMTGSAMPDGFFTPAAASVFPAGSEPTPVPSVNGSK